MNKKKIYYKLKQVHNLKRKEIKKFTRDIFLNNESEKRENELYLGSVWGIDDKSVPFDGNRKDENIKNSLRPCLTLQTPNSFENYDLVQMAPGTTNFHNVGHNYPECLRADVPPEDLNQTTYFLIYLRWSSIQKNLDRKICDLSTQLKKYIE